MNLLTRAQRRQLKRVNAQMPAGMTPVPRDQWPTSVSPPAAVWRSREFVAMLYVHESMRRLSVLRVTTQKDDWADEITWDQLQRVKRECGFGEVDAVEVYPRDSDVVNVANIRHLWLMDEPVAFAWRRG